MTFAPVAGAADVQVHASRNGDTFDVSAFATFEAGIPVAWEVLTDYDRLPSFIPGMHSSRLLSREGNRAVVQQRGEAGLLFFRFPIEVRLSIEEHAPHAMLSQATAGNFRELNGAYRLEAEGARTRLSYHGRFTPDFDIPPLIGTMVVRHTLEQRFRALVQEMLRRQADRRQPVAGSGR
ncbi:MAG TPA: SRPBCC family protein [Burkholderiales bacterium]|nr:SRPBCC family protein [Burkholderiales bacterium]